VSDEPGVRAEVDHYGSQYGHFRSEVLTAVRREAFGEDYGQNGWQTADELDLFVESLALGPESRLLDVACGSGGPSLRIAEKTGASVVGIDIHEDGISTAKATAADRGLHSCATFRQANASGPLPFAAATFDAVLCVDAINHLPDRAGVLAEWDRVLEPGGRLLYTDPIVVTGWLSDEEMRIRSSIGFFLFFPLGENERLLAEAGFEILAVEDRTENMASMAERWREARERHAAELRKIEGDEAFDGQQTFFETASRLAAERRLSRYLFLGQKR
jgi:ubiquinone/menaquinone biosynthesis C-methylase UbiE